MFQQKTLVRALVAAAFGCAATGALAVDFVNGLALPGGALDVSGGTTVNDGRLGF